MPKTNLARDLNWKAYLDGPSPDYRLTRSLKDFYDRAGMPYSHKSIGDEMASLYSSLSKSIHEYKSFETSPGQYKIFAPANVMEVFGM